MTNRLAPPLLLPRRTATVSFETHGAGSRQPSRLSHLDLTVPVRQTGSRLSQIQGRTSRLDDDHFFDSSDDESSSPSRRTAPLRGSSPRENAGVKTYKKICKKYKLIPIQKLARQLGKGTITASNLNMSPKEIKAFFVALVEYYINDSNHKQGESDALTTLVLDGNNMATTQIMFVADFGQTHSFLTDLSLGGCGLCSHALTALTRFITKVQTIHRLDISNNNIGDVGHEAIADLIQNSNSLEILILRGNKLSESGVQLGKAISENTIMKFLDLSWNHIRGNGAIGIAKGLANNVRLETLVLSWNGFGYEGCVAMGNALANNTTLKSLDLANNRIHQQALFELMKGLEKNKTLVVLKLGENPITAAMTSVLLAKILKAKESNLMELDLQGLVVDKEFEGILKQIQDERLFFTNYERSLPLHKGPVREIDPENVFNVDPLRILKYMKEHLKTIHLFLKVGIDGEHRLSKEEMKFAFERDGYPITDSALEKVMKYLTANKDNHVELMEVIKGKRRLKQSLFNEQEEALLGEQEKDKKSSQPLAVADSIPREEKIPRKLPPLNGPKMK